MPDEAYWETLFDVELILDRLGIDGLVHNVVEVGSGYGTFTVAVARRISGCIEAVDIDPAMVERTRRRAAEAGLMNVVCRERDIVIEGLGVPSDSQDACLLFNILHGENPIGILAEAARSVRPNGFVHVIHWRYDPSTPRGPSMDIRPRPEQIMAWARESNMLEPYGTVLDLPPWHYGIRFRRRQDKHGINEPVRNET